jgi:hypothetical protein
MHAGVVLGLAALGGVATVIACSSSGSASHDGGTGDASSPEAAGGSSGSGSGASSSGGASSGATSSSGGGSSGAASSSGGGSSSGSASSSGGGSSSGSASSSGGGSSSGGDGGSSGGTTSAYAGGLGAQIVPGGGTSIYEISGGFFAAPDAGTAGACAGTTSGACCFAPIADAGTSSGGPPTYVSAGTITVKNAATTIATMNPAGNGTYSDSSATDKTVTWTPGDTLAVSAAGDTVHAFTGNLVTVVDIAGSNPALSSTGAAVTISRSADFTLSWTPGPGPTDAMYFTILALVTGASGGGSITCRGVDSDGQFVVDKTLLANLAVGDSAILSLQRTSSSTVVNDNTTLVLTSDTVVSGNGKIAK